MNGWKLANVGGAILIGVTPCLLLGGGAGAWACALFARQSPSELLARPL